jgi:fumiquinazoline A oxidase
MTRADPITAAGSCPCVGVVGAMLGGGHGRLQGKHGLTADALRSLRVILWNGTTVTASASQNSDLFWGMKGARQNFGVVPSATFETYAQVPDGLHYNADMVFADEALEQVIGVINKLIPTQPAPLALHFIFFADPITLEVSRRSYAVIPPGRRNDAEGVTSPSFP